MAPGTSEKLSGPERPYLKLLEMEAGGQRALDTYQNILKAFRVKELAAMMASRQANRARLKSAAELGKWEMGETAELGGTVLRGVLYALWELGRGVAADEALARLRLNLPDWIGDASARGRAVAIADFLAAKLERMRPDEAAGARVRSQAIQNQKPGG
jgi:putative DNA methylase